MKKRTKTFQIVMLATDKAEKGCLLKANVNNLLSLNNTYLTQSYLKNELRCNSFQLYITSDEEIKEGNWVLLPNGIIKKMSHSDILDYLDSESFATKKVIATTDPSLGLPSLPESFIQAYIKAYNEGNPITEVALEMEKDECITCECHSYRDCISYSLPKEIKCGRFEYFKLKTREDNTVIVHQSKSYSREELISIVKEAVRQSRIAYSSLDKIGIDKWIEENI